MYKVLKTAYGKILPTWWKGIEKTVHLLAACSVLIQKSPGPWKPQIVCACGSCSAWGTFLAVCCSGCWCVTLLQAGGSWRSKLSEPQPDDDRRGMRLACVGRSLHSLYDSLERNLFTVVTSMWAGLFLNFHCARMLISFKLVIFIGTVCAIAYWVSVCGTLFCDTVLHLHSIYLTDMISWVSVPVTIAMYSWM
jgi:hypothetical protein